jgi:superfamily II DNA or RNA helicase
MFHPPTVNSFLGEYPDVTDPTFNRKIYHKKEFYNLRLDEKKEDVPPSGELYKTQKLISRFLGPHTLYNGMLIFWEMGAGKTLAAIGTAENLGEYYKQAYFFSKGTNIEDTIIADLSSKMYPNKYSKDDQSRIRSEIKAEKFYKFKTFSFFDNLEELDKSRYNELVKEFSNSLIVIDEVHNLRETASEAGEAEEPGEAEEADFLPKKKSKKPVKYIQAHRFLHDLENCKVILMSGTPMKDGPDEIASILNLILPLENQLENFKADYLFENEGVFDMKPDKIDEFKLKIKGSVSFLKTMPSLVTRTYMGQKIGKLKEFKVVPVQMSEFQTKVYFEAIDIKSDILGGLQTKARQASLLVYPSGDAGLYGKDLEKIRNSDFDNFFRGKTNAETILKIKDKSAVYGSLIETLIENPKRKAFVYNTYVKGSGINKFARLLRLVGFSAANGKETDKKLRYVHIKSDQPRDEQKRLIDSFNQPKNKYGEYIQVLLSSRILMEGVNLMDVLDVFITTPHWNYSETSQATYRALRLGSHENLIKEGITPNVHIYQYVAMPLNEPERSIDLLLYEKSEQKDLSIKNMEYILKTAAFDCGLNYKRNIRPSTLDKTRECEYRSCEYKCDGLPLSVIKNGLSPEEIDQDTYDLYYQNEIFSHARDEILKMFQIRFIYSAPEILDEMKSKFNYSEFIVFSALDKIIAENTPILNPNGFKNFLREDKDICFLVDSVSSVSDYGNNYYARSPVVLKTESYDDIMTDILLENLQKASNSAEFARFFTLLPQSEQDTVRTLLFDEEQPIVNENEQVVNFRQFATEYFSSKTEGPFSSLPVQSEETEAQIPLEYASFGLMQGDKFTIKRRSTAKNKREIKTGINCASIKIPDLIVIILNLKIPYGNSVEYSTKQGPENRSVKTELNLQPLDETKFTALLSSPENFNVKNIIDNNKVTDLEDKKRVFYFSKLKTKKLCEIIKQWYLENNLMLQSKSK